MALSQSLLVAFAWAGFSAQAADRPTRLSSPTNFVVACPSNWPNSEHSQATLLATNTFFRHLGMIYPAPEDPEFTTEGPGEIQMDCIYDGGLHLTIEVPGFPVTCHAAPSPDGGLTRRPAVCVTRPGPDGKLGPTRQILAEPLTLDSTIQGFGLRWSLERVVKTTKAAGYATEMKEKEIGGRRVMERVRASKEGDQVDILFSETTGLSREVVWPGPKGPVERRLAFAKDMALRFGLTAEYSSSLYPRASTDRRKGFNNPAILDVVQRRGPGEGEWQDTVHLIDGESESSASSR